MRIIKTFVFFSFLASTLLARQNTTATGNETGIPVVRNFSPSDYKGHTQNFDIAEDNAGNIYIANFAGVLVYNGQEWSIVLTPDISRVTAVERSEKGQILVGGLNEIGMIKSSDDGKLYYEDLRPLISAGVGHRFGEIKDIFNLQGKNFFFSRKKILAYNGKDIEILALPDELAQVFPLENNFLIKSEANSYYLFDPSRFAIIPFDYLSLDIELTSVLRIRQDEFLLGTAEKGLMYLKKGILSPFEASLNKALIESRISDLIRINANLIAIGTHRNGIFFINPKGDPVTWVNRSFGLQNDYINKLYKDKGNRLWAALNNGISLVGYPWPWTVYNRNNGLKSGVISITRNEGSILAGTYQGLYRLNGSTKLFSPFEDIETSCWQFLHSPYGLLVATSEGIYSIKNSGINHLTNEFTLCMASFEARPGYLYAGTLDGFSEIRLSEDGGVIRNIAKFSDLGEVTDLVFDDEGNIWITTLNGRLARYEVETDRLNIFGKEQDLPDLPGNQFYSLNNELIASTSRGLRIYNHTSGLFEEYRIKADTSNSATSWPGLIAHCKDGSMWITKGDETGLSHFVPDNGTWKYKKEDFGPFQNFITRSVYEDTSGIMWFGGPSGLIRFDQQLTKNLWKEPSVKISDIQLNNDSIFSGGSDTWEVQQKREASFGYSYRNVSFRFASSGYHVANQVLYSYRLIGLDNKWSDWNAVNDKEYQNLSPGSYIFLVKSKDVYGNVSEAAEFRFEIRFPWYLKWYMIITYLLALCYMVWQIIQLRLKSLVREKEKLENTVQERTSEIRKQRDKVQRKSEELSHALGDLKNTQEELIRQEKLASVGQMAKGIVDRIINPLNYINNFSSLSKDLALDLKEVLEAEKETISEDGYGEIEDIRSMLDLNLGKIQDHGTNSVRIIKNMEELLKDRTGRFTETDISEMVVQILKRVKNNFEKEIDQYGIEVDLHSDGNGFGAKVIIEELTKALYELFNNAMQSVVSNCKKNNTAEAHVIGELRSTDSEIILKVRDNGMGIPEREIDRIYDPFFTTKPAAKGSGVGLYLVREIIYLHKGTISVNSEVNTETVFTVVLPKK